MSDLLPFAAEPVTIVKFAQPRCGKVFGQSVEAHGRTWSCSASGAPCYGTRATCRVGDQFHTAGDDTPIAGPLALYFGLPGAGRPSDLPAPLPLLSRVEQSSPRINIAGSDRRANPFGLLGEGTIAFHDTAHSDFVIDPNRAARAEDPAASGTFWTKWAARNPYACAGMEVTIFEGFAGQPLASYRRRLWLSNGLDLSEGGARMKLADPLLDLSRGKSELPVQSSGYLVNAIGAGDMSCRIAGAPLEDYAPNEWWWRRPVRIGSEIINVASLSVDGSGVINMTFAARGVDGSGASGHAAGDPVQVCIRLDDMSVPDGLNAIVGSSNVRPGSWSHSDWQAEGGRYLLPYILRGVVSKPTPVRDLVGDILEQAQSVMWWDGWAAQIRFRAITPMSEIPAALSHEAEILQGSFSLKDRPDRRVSQVWIYFDPRNQADVGSDVEDYRRVHIAANLSQEDGTRWGSPAVRQIYARYVGLQSVAAEAGSRILGRYEMGAREVSFAVSDRDFARLGLGICRLVTLSHPRIAGEDGARDVRQWIITSAELDHAARRWVVSAEDATLSGQLRFIAPDGTPDFPGRPEDMFSAYIAQNNGLMPDGSEGTKIQ